MKQRVQDIVDYITFSVFEKELRLLVEVDKKFGGRIYLQVAYDCVCFRTGAKKEWHGRKWYLSEHMTDDEIVKTAYVAFEAAVKHEVMEGFRYSGTTVFNPHVDFRELIAISDREVRRSETIDANMEI